MSALHRNLFAWFNLVGFGDMADKIKMLFKTLNVAFKLNFNDRSKTYIVA